MPWAGGEVRQRKAGKGGAFPLPTPWRAVTLGNMAKYDTRQPRRNFGEIEARSSGTFRARYTGPDLQRHARTFSESMAAQGWLFDEAKLIERDEWTPPEYRSVAVHLTVNQYVALQLPSRRLAPRTREEYDSYLKRFVTDDVLGRMALRSVTSLDVMAWWGRVQAATGEVHASNVYGFVASIFNAAVEDKSIEASPCRIKNAADAPRQSPKTAATPAEVAAVVAAVPERYRALVLVAAWGGLRSGELRNLRRQDVDLAAGTVSVRQQVQNVREQGLVVRDVKSKAAVRTVYLPRHVVAVLAHQMTRAQWGRDGLVFPSTVGTPIAQAVLWRVWDKARRSIGRPDLRFHDLRHTAAILAAQTGATVAELQARLGHATPAAAMTYQHAVDGADAVIAARLEGLAAAAG